MGPFWGSFWGQNGVKKWTLFWKGSWWPSGGTLGGFLAVLGLSWEAWCSRFTAKTDTKQHISKSLLFAIGAPWYGFWRPCWLILGRFWAPNRAQKPCKTGPKTGPKFYNFLDQFLANSGVHSGAQNCSRRGPKIGPLLEPGCPASQGSERCVFRNYTRGVQRLLELELYSPKEREGST